MNEYWWSDTYRGEQKYSTQRKTCPSATLSTINLTWTDLGLNLGISGDRIVSNCLSHGTAYIQRKFLIP
jgi:hypothetical protein